MSCFRPIKGFRCIEGGYRGLTFNPLKALNSALPLMLPCGQCNGCLHDRAAAWAIRLGHEAVCHDRSCFVTLTYSDEAVPVDFSLKKRDAQLFMMRLRKRFGAGIRFFCAGEYSDAPKLRPHYHFLLFGVDFRDDRYPWTKRNNHQVWRSPALEELWPHGQSELGSVTPASAGYVARYCLKKMTGPKADAHYFRVSPVDGNAYRVEPDFSTMSRGGRGGLGGIGQLWFDRFASDAFPSDFVVVDGHKRPVPAFYLRQLSDVAADPIKRARKAKAAKPAAKWNRSKERLAVREEVHAARVSRLVRTL